MKTLLAAILLTAATSAVALADDGQLTPAPCTQPCAAVPAPSVALQPTYAAPQPAAAAPLSQPGQQVGDGTDEDTGWHRPAGQRFTSGFRLGYMYLANYDKPNRIQSDGTMKSLKDEFGLKNPNMFLIGYEGFYRIVGHSWLNVLMVGNVSVAGLDQSKFIPTANGLLGFEIDRSFELGVGINLLPDSKAPSHMIVAAGWTPKVGSIQTPIHAFFIPDSPGTDAMGNQLPSNWRAGATIGMNW
jgi:hypothetical protein